MFKTLKTILISMIFAISMFALTSTAHAALVEQTFDSEEEKQAEIQRLLAIPFEPLEPEGVVIDSEPWDPTVRVSIADKGSSFSLNQQYAIEAQKADNPAAFEHIYSIKLSDKTPPAISLDQNQQEAFAKIDGTFFTTTKTVPATAKLDGKELKTEFEYAYYYLNLKDKSGGEHCYILTALLGYQPVKIYKDNNGQEYYAVYGQAVGGVDVPAGRYKLVGNEEFDLQYISHSSYATGDYRFTTDLKPSDGNMIFHLLENEDFSAYIENAKVTIKDYFTNETVYENSESFNFKVSQDNQYGITPGGWYNISVSGADDAHSTIWVGYSSSSADSSNTYKTWKSIYEDDLSISAGTFHRGLTVLPNTAVSVSFGVFSPTHCVWLTKDDNNIVQYAKGEAVPQQQATTTSESSTQQANTNNVALQNNSNQQNVPSQTLSATGDSILNTLVTLTILALLIFGVGQIRMLNIKES